MRPALALGLGAALAMLGACRQARPEPAQPLAPLFASTPVHSVVTGEGALLTRPARPVSRAATRGPQQDLVDDGWQASAVTASGPAGSVAAVVERREVARDHVLERDNVYRLEGGRWSLVLELTQALGGGESGARVRSDDLLGDGHPLLVFVFPEAGGRTAPSDRAVDVVDGSGAVVVHRELYHGAVRRAPGGGLETWKLAPATGGRLFLHEVDRAVAGPWMAEVSDLVPAGTVPGAAERF